jgi:hypothetical protein
MGGGHRLLNIIIQKCHPIQKRNSPSIMGDGLELAEFPEFVRGVVGAGRGATPIAAAIRVTAAIS